MPRSKVAEDGWRLSSDVAERRSPEEQQALERLTSWVGAHMRSIRLPDLLIEVDNELDWSREDHGQVSIIMSVLIDVS